MQIQGSHPEKAKFFGFTGDELAGVVKGLGWPAFRTKQVQDWLYQKTVGEPRDMTNLSKLDREKLAGAFDFATATITRRQESSDGTIKLLLTWADESNAETVMIPDGDR